MGASDFITRGQAAVLLKRLRDEIKGMSAAEPSASLDRSSERNRQASRLAASASLNSGASTSSQGDESEPEEEENEEDTAEAAANPAGNIRFTIDKFTVDENKGSAQISVVRTGGEEGSVSAEYSLEDGTAKSGEDYEVSSGVINFAGGETSKMFSMKINEDEVSEGDETVKIKLSNPSGGAKLSTPHSAVLTIKDNEKSSSSSSANGSIEFSALAYDVAESASGAEITVVRNGSSSSKATVTYSMNSGTATSENYTPSSGTISFAAGETAKSFKVKITDNKAINGNKTVNLSLSSPSGAELGSVKSAVMTIVDDEVMQFGSGSLKFSRMTFEALESDGFAQAEVLRIGGADGSVSVEYSTDGGTAVAVQDYEVTTGTITFGPNESGEKINLKLKNPIGGAKLGNPSDATVEVY